MKKIIILLVFIFFSLGISAQNSIGAWERVHILENGEKVKSVVIISEGYQVMSTFKNNTGEFVSTNGGTWRLIDDTITEIVEFDTSNPERVGMEVNFKVFITDSLMRMEDGNIVFNRIDHGDPGKLQGAWLMSGRIKDGETQFRDTSGPRKTMKILSGTRFQWIAYNTETKQFMGTGGGTYTTVDGEYTENIEFFSRDNSRAGSILKFNYNLIDGNWHHSGLSSKGDPIHEIWSLRE
ncbi:hypothetical protein JM83_3151 [Gillisia sp. Hel_I_86]|uniref:membrane or secreted protein n=1 Tax=Gillisia sp. Hel_I_86 TaxID=1249981 RepID=UPI00119BA27E|nr:membrane or secreted protein [Gillisia sp. Hel_I_86]TVZ28064.1 hypothetical protein JM83_3151 [Gillisia sp. Hel_I_86]